MPGPERPQPFEAVVSELDNAQIHDALSVVRRFRKEMIGHPLIAEITLAVTAQFADFDKSNGSFVIRPEVRVYTHRDLTPEEQDELPSIALVDDESEAGLRVQYVTVQPEEDRAWHSLEKTDVLEQ